MSRAKLTAMTLTAIYTIAVPQFAFAAPNKPPVLPMNSDSPDNQKNNEATQVTPDLDYSRWKYHHFHHDATDLRDIRILLKDGVHSVNVKPSPIPLDFLSLGFNNQGKEFLVVLSGAVTDSTRGNSSPPYFSGVGLASDLHLPLFAISDPSLALSHDLNLAWYAGNHYTPDLFTHIADVVDSLAQRTGKKPILLGGSGGGFAAIQILKRLKTPATAIAWNPQTSIGGYYLRAVKRYVTTAYPNIKIPSDASRDSNAFQSFMDRDLDKTQHRLPVAASLSAESELIYLQNISDDYHRRNHAGPWLKSVPFLRIGNGAYLSSKRNILFFTGDWGDGHAAPSPAIIKNLVTQVIKTDSLDLVGLSLTRSSVAAKVPVNWFHADAGLISHVKISASQSDVGLRVEAEIPSQLGKSEDFEYAFEVFSGTTSINRIWYQSGASAILPITEPGEYRIKVYLRDKFDAIKSVAIQKNFQVNSQR